MGVDTVITLDEAREELQVLQWDRRLGTYLCLTYILEMVVAEHGQEATDKLAKEWAERNGLPWTEGGIGRPD